MLTFARTRSDDLLNKSASTCSQSAQQESLHKLSLAFNCSAQLSSLCCVMLCDVYAPLEWKRIQPLYCVFCVLHRTLLLSTLLDATANYNIARENIIRGTS